MKQIVKTYEITPDNYSEIVDEFIQSYEDDKIHSITCVNTGEQINIEEAMQKQRFIIVGQIKLLNKQIMWIIKRKQFENE